MVALVGRDVDEGAAVTALDLAGQQLLRPSPSSTAP